MQTQGLNQHHLGELLCDQKSRRARDRAVPASKRSRDRRIAALSDSLRMRTMGGSPVCPWLVPRFGETHLERSAPAQTCKTSPSRATI
jgi:hypothetical protein